MDDPSYTLIDQEWREEYTERLQDVGITVVNPMVGKKMVNGKCMKYGYRVDNKMIFHEDRAGMAKCNVLVWNLLAFSDYYPCIGSLIEIGMNNKRDDCLMFIISDNEQIINHPFIQESVCKIFMDKEDCLEYIIHLLCE